MWGPESLRMQPSCHCGCVADQPSYREVRNKAKTLSRMDADEFLQQMWPPQPSFSGCFPMPTPSTLPGYDPWSLLHARALTQHQPSAVGTTRTPAQRATDFPCPVLLSLLPAPCHVMSHAPSSVDSVYTLHTSAISSLALDS